MNSYYQKDFRREGTLGELEQAITATGSSLAREIAGSRKYVELSFRLGFLKACKWFRFESHPEQKAAECIGDFLGLLESAARESGEPFHKQQLCQILLWVCARTAANDSLPYERQLVETQESLMPFDCRIPYPDILVKYCLIHTEDPLGSQKLLAWAKNQKFTSQLSPQMQSGLSFYILQNFYEQGGEVEHLRIAIDLGSMSIAGIDKVTDAVEKGYVYLNHSSNLVRRYESSGNVDDLNEAISLLLPLLSKAKTLNDDERELQESVTTNLGYFMRVRFERLRTLSDLECAERYSKVALRLANPMDFQNLAKRMNSLSIVYARFYDRTGSLRYLEEALQLSEDAATKTHGKNPDSAMILNQLALCKFWRYDRFCRDQDLGKAPDPSDLDSAIENIQMAIDMVPLGYPLRLEFVSNLCRYIAAKYKSPTVANICSLETIDNAISLGEEDLPRIPSASPARIKQLWSLAELYLIKSDKIQEERSKIFDKAKSLILDAVKSPSAPSSHRISVAYDATKLFIARTEYKVALEIAKSGVELLAIASTRTSGKKDQQDILRRYTGLSSKAAALVLELGGSAAEAASILERGRGVITSFQYEAKSDLMELKTCHPHLASEFELLRDSVFAPFDSTDAEASEHIQKTLRREADSKKLDDLILRIRSIEGFEFFLDAVNPDLFVEVAREMGSTIVMINVAFRCDAILINEFGISSIPLAYLDEETIQEKREAWDLKETSAYGRTNILIWMWTCFMKYIIEGIAITKPNSPKDGRWLRICFIPTGSLCYLPLHAAGDHEKETGETVLDCAIPSYGLSIRALSHTYEAKTRSGKSTKKPETRDDRDSILLVAMDETPGQESLPFARVEVQKLEDQIGNSLKGSRCTSLFTPTKDLVLSHMNSAKIFHYAGHGSVNGEDLSLSGIVLTDGCLTVSDMESSTKSMSRQSLAYLSACSTGFNASEDLADEGLHLMSACLVAGFSSVVGTLWNVSDSICVKVSELFYNSVGKEWDTAKALHSAIRTVRYLENKGPSGKRHASVVGDSDPIIDDPKLWSAYIHMGYCRGFKHDTEDSLSC